MVALLVALPRRGREGELELEREVGREDERLAVELDSDGHAALEHDAHVARDLRDALRPEALRLDAQIDGRALREERGRPRRRQDGFS